MKQKYIVKMILRKDKEKKDGTCPLYLQVLLNGKPLVKLSTGESGKKDNWDSKSQSFIGKGFGIRENNRLRTIVLETEDFIKLEKSKGNFVSAEMIKSFFKNEDHQCYFTYFDEVFCKTRFRNLAQSTIDKYLLLRKSLKEFKPKLRLNEVDFKFLHSFRNFLINEKEIGKGGVWNREKNFRATLKFAFDLKLMEEYPYRNFKLDKPKCKNTALSLEELNKIVEVDLKGNKRLEEIRDKFLFACYTGLRFGDMSKLKWENIENGMIKIVQEKTKSPVSIPLNDEAKMILDKNSKHKEERETVFRVISNQKTNYVLKDIASLAKVEQKVSFHLSRHTFGTVLGRSENAFIIMKLMGHKKISTSAIYVNTDVNELTRIIHQKSKNLNVKCYI